MASNCILIVLHNGQLVDVCSPTDVDVHVIEVHDENVLFNRDDESKVYTFVPSIIEQDFNTYVPEYYDEMTRE